MDLELMMITALVFIFYMLIIKYLKHLEEIGCECAMTFKRKYILYFNCVNLVLFILSLTEIMSVFKKNKNLYSIFRTIYLVSLILNIVYTIQYVNELKRNNCDCSEDIRRDVMYYFSIIDAIIIFISFVVTISTVTSLIVHLSLNEKVNLKKISKKYKK